MFKRYDPDAKLTIYYAAIIATHANAQKIGTNELLLGLSWREHSHDCPFCKLKEDFQELWSKAGYPHLPMSAVPYKPSKVPLDRDAKLTLALAAKAADTSGDYWIDIDHLMRGLLQQKCNAAQILRDTGWTIDAVTAAGEDARRKHPVKPAPWLRRLMWKYHRFFGTS